MKKCECGKINHAEDAKFCSMCGGRLTEVILEFVEIGKLYRLHNSSTEMYIDKKSGEKYIRHGEGWMILGKGFVSGDE